MCTLPTLSYAKAIVIQYIITSQKSTSSLMEQDLEADSHMIWKTVHRGSHVANQQGSVNNAVNQMMDYTFVEKIQIFTSYFV